MPDRPTTEPEVFHQLKNHLSVIVGYSELLLEEMSESDPRHADIREVHASALAAMELVATLTSRPRSAGSA